MNTNDAPPIIAYLDMNVWVAMARGRDQADVRWNAAYHGLMEAADLGQIVIPLAIAHYLELWHRRDQYSREDVGSLMRDLSGYVTIMPPHAVRCLELDSAIRYLLGEPLEPLRKDQYIGFGAEYAFGNPDGRFRFVESVAGVENAYKEGASVVPPEGWELIVPGDPLWALRGSW